MYGHTNLYDVTIVSMVSVIKDHKNVEAEKDFGLFLFTPAIPAQVKRNLHSENLNVLDYFSTD